MSKSRSAALAAVFGALSFMAGPAHAASVWRTSPSGTTATISSIAYPTPGNVVFATAAGQIYYGGPAGFKPAAMNPANYTALTRVAMSPDGTRGVAVGLGGKIYFSADAGHTWNLETPPAEVQGSCTTYQPSTGPLTDDLSDVQYADANTVYIAGASYDVLKSTDGGATFTEVNKVLAGDVPSCKVGQVSAFDFLDASNGFLGVIHSLYATPNGINGTNGTNAEIGGLTSNMYFLTVAVDHRNPQHMVAATTGTNGLGFDSQVSVDGGRTWNEPTWPYPGPVMRGAATKGGTALLVGNAGALYDTTDFRSWAKQAGPATAPAADWTTVAMLDGSHAVAGGAKGEIAFTDAADKTTLASAPKSRRVTVGCAAVTAKAVSATRMTFAVVRHPSCKLVVKLSGPSKTTKTLGTLSKHVLRSKFTLRLAHPGVFTVRLTARHAGVTKRATFTIQAG